MLETGAASRHAAVQIVCALAFGIIVSARLHVGLMSSELHSFNLMADTFEMPVLTCTNCVKLEKPPNCQAIYTPNPPCVLQNSAQYPYEHTRKI